MIDKIKAIALIILFILMSATMVPAAQLLFTPTLILSEEYTDNVFLTPNNETDDYITSASLGLSGQVLGRTAGLELNYTPSYNKFADNSDLDYWRHAASLYAWKVFKRTTRLELRNTYLRSSDPRDQSNAIDPANPLLGSAIETDVNRRGRSEYYTNVAELRVNHQFGANDNVYAAYNYSLLRDVDTIAGQRVNDNDIRTVSAGVAYDFSNKWTTQLDAYRRDAAYVDDADHVEYNGELRVLYNFDRTFSGFVAYRHTVLDYDATANEDFNVYRPLVGVELRFQNNARISIGVGYYFQDFDTSDDESGFIATSEVYKKWDYRRTYVDLLGTSGYDIDDTGVQNNGLRIYYTGRIELGYRFTQRLSSFIYSAYRHDNYPNAVPNRTDKTLNTGLGLEWQILQWMTSRLTYNYSDVNSDLPTNEYTENSVLLKITFSPTSPYRLN